MNKETKQPNLTSIKIEGSSMFPVLKNGDKILAKDLDWRNARIGDILAYERPGEEKLVVHRLVKKIVKNDQILFITQGDANASYCSDEPFDPRIRQLKKAVAVVKINGILGIEDKISRIGGFCKAVFLWYMPFLILPHRKLKKAITSPSQIPKETARNMSGLIRRYRKDSGYFNE